MEAWRPVSTNVIVQFWMSVLSRWTFEPPFDITKSFAIASLYVRKKCLIASALYPRQSTKSVKPKCA